MPRVRSRGLAVPFALVPVANGAVLQEHAAAPGHGFRPGSGQLGRHLQRRPGFGLRVQGLRQFGRVEQLPGLLGLAPELPLEGRTR